MKKILVCLLFITSLTQAQSYLDAKRGIAKGDDIAQYRNLKNHALYPYLAYDFYRKNLSRTDEITTIFDKHFAAPPTKKLLNLWVKNQYLQQNYNNVVRYYFDSGSQQANCIYRASLLAVGKRKQALHGIERIWSSPASVSDFCDSVFSAWGKSNEQKLVFERAKKAYHAGNTDFAGRLAERLYGESGNVIKQFVRYNNNPTQLLMQSTSDLTRTALHKALLPRALGKLVRKDSVSNAAFAMRFNGHLKNDSNYQAMLDKLTVYLANRQDAQVKQSFALLSHPSNDANAALIRYLVANGDWSAVRKLIDVDKNNNSMALYWLGRAYEAKGQQSNAKKAYAKAAKNRSYYGFLAADKIKQPYHFDFDPIQPTAAVQNNLDKNSNLIRAKLLKQYSQNTDAKREIFAISGLMDKSHKRQLAYWLDRHGFHHEAIYVLGKVRDWNDIRIRFPTPFNSEVSVANKKTGIDPTWIYAIIRQESTMNPLAKSHANAKGLMQLIPGTARRMARDLGLSLHGNAIYRAGTNTQLGANYLKKMFLKYGSLAFASAAYNAGPGRVNRWTADGVGDMTIWVEKIPFNETRKYVKNILEYQQVYAKHLNYRIPTLTKILNYRR